MAAYTLRRTGTVVTSSSQAALTPSPGTHNTNYFTGDLLLCATIARPGIQTLATPTGWTQLAISTTQCSVAILARIADGGANDTPSIDWDSSTSRSVAWIDVFYGDVCNDLTTIAAHADTGGGGSFASIPVQPLAITTNDCLVYAVGAHKNDATVATVTTVSASSGQSFTMLGSYIVNTANAALHAGSQYWQQTTATTLNGNDMTLDGDPRTAGATGIVLALRTASAFAVTGVSDGESLYDGMAVTITGTGFGAAQGASTVVVRTADGSPTVTQTPSVWSDTEIVFPLESSVLPFGSVDVRVTVGGTTITTGKTLVSAPGYANGVANVPWPIGGSSVFDSASPAVVDGDLYEYEALTDQSVSVTVLADGTFIINSPTDTHKFDVRVYDQTDETWSAWTEATVSAAASASGGSVIRNVFALSSVAGLRKWVDYIPVKVVAPASVDLDTFNDSGALETVGLATTAGKVAWVDYIPVFVVTDPASGRARFDDLGWIAITDV